MVAKRTKTRHELLDRFRVECDQALFGRIVGELQGGITGKPVILGDTLIDLVKRHCPHIHTMASENGFRLELDDDPKNLELKPPFGPRIFIGVLRTSWQ